MTGRGSRKNESRDQVLPVANQVTTDHVGPNVNTVVPVMSSCKQELRDQVLLCENHVTTDHVVPDGRCIRGPGASGVSMSLQLTDRRLDQMIRHLSSRLPPYVDVKLKLFRRNGGKHCTHYYCTGLRVRDAQRTNMKYIYV